MTNPIDLILKYFRPAASLPDVGKIATKAVLEQIGKTLVALIAVLKIVPLNGAERTSFTGKDQGNQPKRSRAFMRLGEKRPHLADKAGVDLNAFKVITMKDDSFDVLFNTLDQISTILGDGVLMVRATLSQEVITVLDYVRKVNGGGVLPPDQAGKVRVAFNGVDLNAVAAANRAADKLKRDANKHVAKVNALADGKDILMQTPDATRLVADATEGKDMSLNLSPTPKKPARKPKAKKAGVKAAAGAAKKKTKKQPGGPTVH